MRLARSAFVLTLAAAGIAIGACGAGTGSEAASTRTSRAEAISSRSRPAPQAATGVLAAGVEHALVTLKPEPHPSAADCRAPTRAERESAPFGHTRIPVLSCSITLSSETSRFDVQVLANGCFVAERQHPGQSIWGCGVKGAQP